ncbi:MAG TPA: endopeptidase La [Candidatus Micrarchaeia archaeon]|nr:endopeptidase La [Candidatus Micrarchaeia archaeon]
MSELQSQLLPILPVSQGVVLPHMVVTTVVEGAEATAAIGAGRSGVQQVLVVPRIDGRYARIGTVARIEEVGQLPTGVEAVVLRGLHRARLTGAATETGGALWVTVEPAPDPETTSERAHEVAREYRALIENVLEFRGAPGAVQMVRGIQHPGQLADMSGYSPDLSLQQKVEVLETLDVEQRLERLVKWTRDILAEISVKDQIKSEVGERMEKTQRDFLLRQQLEAIKRQLGEGDDSVVAEYRRKLDDAAMPEAVKSEVLRELDRLERTSEQSPEHGWIRGYLDWMLAMPWGVRSEDRFDIQEARRILDADHSGLNDVKDRIIEFLTIRRRREARGMKAVSGRGSGAIITLVGPPGVGKTSLGESVARALGRKFARVSLGGVHDEAEIRGHRRTYVGAMPGRIARALREAGTKNPVVMLDEIDKVGNDWRGDPAAALLEALDPAQNHSFRDHYLDVDLDLSEVLFIPTANVVETIPQPLLDRMEVIALDGYTEDEKLAIAEDHLLPRQLEQSGLDPEEVTVTADALRRIIAEHTREAGVRGLERQLARLLRKVATRIDRAELAPPVAVDAAQVREVLGRARFESEVAERTEVAGVATGLAVTGTGGDILFIEATRLTEDGGLTLTGQLGDVMKESAQIALSYVRSHAEAFGIDAGTARRAVHLHVPAGAVPKDGPSAGVAMVTALASLFTGRPVRHTVAMTGEVTLQGRVLPIGGVKQKVLAARRAGITDVLLPQRNQPELEELSEAVRGGITFHLVGDVREVLEQALTGLPETGDGAAPAARRTSSAA